MASHQSSMRGHLLGDVPDTLPGRVAVPGLQVRRAVEALDFLGQAEVVQGEVLGGPDPVHAVHRDRVVVHVGGRPPVGVSEEVKPQPVVHVHPGSDVALDEVHPAPVPLLERLRRPGRIDVLVELPDDVGVVAVEREFPLLVGVAELVPPKRRPVVALATRARVTLGLRPVRAPGLESRPVQRVPAPAVGETVEPPLGEVMPRVGLDLDRHVLVVGLLALGRRVVVVPAGGRVREYLRPGLRVGKDRLGNTAFWSGCHEVSPSL